MECNLALVILRYVILGLSIGESESVPLSDFKKFNRIPSGTFHRHVNSLIQQGFLQRKSRDKYVLNSLFVERVTQVKEAQNERNDEVIFDDFPF